MSYAGYYINLDRSTERRMHIETELERYNLTHNYQRFCAADGNSLNIKSTSLNPGHLGCWTSHYLLLKENLGREQHLHVVEDDVIFASCTERVIHSVIASGYLDRCDILFTDISIPLLNEVYKVYKALYDKNVVLAADGKIESVKFEAIDLSKIIYSSTTSFLVNKNSVQKIYNMYEQEIKRGLEVPIDLFIRHKNHAGELKVGTLFPFITSFRLDAELRSEISPLEDRSGMIAAGIGRYAFFVGCDWDLCRTYINRYVAPPTDQLTRTLGELLTFSLTDKYRFY